MSDYTGQAVLVTLPKPFAGYPQASIVNIDVPARVIHFHLADAAGTPRQETNTALFEGTFTDSAIAADIYNDLTAHA